MKGTKTYIKRKITAPLLCLVPTAVYYALLIAFVFGVIIIFAFADFPDSAFDAILYGPIAMIVEECTICAGAVVGCIIVKKRNKTSLNEVLTVKDFDIMVPLMLLIFGWAAGELCDHFGGLLLSQFMRVEPNRSAPDGWIGVFVVVIGAPVFEELMFRYNGTELPRGTYSVPVICIANGLFFATVHMYNIQGFMNVFIGGVAAAYVYCKTRNLLYTMLEHAIHNALCYLPIQKVAYYERRGFVLSEGWWLVLNAVLLGISLIWYVKVFRKKYTKNYFEKNYETGLPLVETAPDEVTESEAMQAQI